MPPQPPEPLPAYSAKDQRRPNLLDVDSAFLTQVHSAPSRHLRFLPEEENEAAPEVFTSLADLPPAYTSLDEIVQYLDVNPPFIYGTSVHETCLPRYQIWMQQIKKTGKPYKLKIRRLLAYETRRLSTSNISDSRSSVDFDHDSFLYIVENIAALGHFSSNSVEIRGRQRSTLPGFISLQKGLTATKFWHVTKSAAGDALREENAKKILKFGYRPDDEVKKDLLFVFQKRSRADGSTWKDGEGQLLARESPEGRLELISVKNTKQRDALTICWLARRLDTGELLGTETFNPNLSLRRFLSANT